jgi:hypothetical protein
MSLLKVPDPEAYERANYMLMLQSWRSREPRYRRRPVPVACHSSRCTVCGENAGRQIATYSAPLSPGVE